ncbi:MAG: hypothetical protein UIM26_02485 [Longicatena sp.]|nr:hypothetical protein [Longicatena sp.]
MFKNLGRSLIPLFIIVISAFLYQTLTHFFGDILMVSLTSQFLLAIILFYFGYVINDRKIKKDDKDATSSELSKIISVTLATLLICFQMEWLYISTVAKAFDFLGIKGLFYSLLYIYCGYLYK